MKSLRTPKRNHNIKRWLQCGRTKLYINKTENMILYRLLLLGLVFSIGILNAQTDFRSGYIIKNSGDTLYGQIDYGVNELMSRICKFRNSDNVNIEYSPNDISGYRFTDSKYYVTKEVNNKKVFMEYLIKGRVNIYYLLDGKGGHYYINKECGQLSEIPYEESIQKIDNKLLLNKSTKHIGLLNYYMHDAPGFQSRIQNIGRPDHNNLIKLAEDYHNAVCKNEKCIIYEKKAGPLKVSITPYIGLTKHKAYNTVMTEFGGYIYLWLPGASEKLCLKTGLAYFKLKENSENLNIYKVPLQLQYVYRAHKLQFLISEGFNVYLDGRDIAHSVSLNPGLGYKISDKISVNAIFSSDYTPVFDCIINDQKIDIITYSILLGLRFDL